MRRLFFILLFLATTYSYSQTTPQPIRTAVPFLTITPDALSSSMGDVGVSTTPDVFSQYHNPAKYAFTKLKSELSASYTPWLSNITGDMFIGYVSYYHHVRQNSAIGASFRCFSLGNVELNEYQNGTVIPLGDYNPLELALDVSYSMKISQRVSLGLALRYTRSDITDHSSSSTSGFHAGNAISADISVFYSSKIFEREKLNFSYSFGLNIRDIGSKINYGSSPISSSYEQMPTMMLLGGGFHLLFPNEQKVSLYLQTSKILVPTPAYDDAEGTYTTADNGIFGNIFSALCDAPGGFAEKITEYTFQMGAEYIFHRSFSARGGWFYSDQGKGGSQYACLGLSEKYKNTTVYLSYNIPTAHQWDNNPISGTLRVSVSFALGGKIDDKF